MDGLTGLTSSARLATVEPDLERILTRGRASLESPALYDESDIRRETVWMSPRDGVKLATDLYLPPLPKAPTLAIRTPYGRSGAKINDADTLLTFARRGYAVISQDCRGTGDSEPAVWDYGLFESEDGVDFVDWVTRQSWFDGFIASFGASYCALTQWCMSAHPRMSAIAPEVAGLRTTRNTVRQYMLVNVYPRVVGKGANRVEIAFRDVERVFEAETMAGGYFNEPLWKPLPAPLLERYPLLRTLPPLEARRWLWAEICGLPAARRAELLKQLMGVSEFSYIEMSGLPAALDGVMTYGHTTIPSLRPDELCRHFHAPALFVSGWYDWNLGDTLPSWMALRKTAKPDVAARSRLIITPAAHGALGYREGADQHPELRHDHRSNTDLLLRWYESVRKGTSDAWPTVIYYLMGANEWRVASDWPVPEAKKMSFYLGVGGTLSTQVPQQPAAPDQYIYDPAHPTPTVGGSILSHLYPTGSVDVSRVQERADVLTYTTEPLAHDLDVVGPLRVILYVGSSAVDTDFAARLSDVFPDGRAIQLQSAMLRARDRDLAAGPQLLEPGKIYRLEIDLWATANRFKAGHRLRLDVSSADFPRFDRNTNRGGEPGEPVRATQTIYHDPEHPSQLLVEVIGREEPVQ